MQNLGEIINDRELYDELVKAYGMTIHSRMKTQFNIAVFSNCRFVSNSQESFVIDYSLGDPYILFEVNES